MHECEKLGINSILSLNIGRSSYGCHSGDSLVKIIKDQADVDRRALKEYMVNNIPGMAELPDIDAAQEVINFIERNDVSNFRKVDIQTNFGNNILIPTHRFINESRSKISVNIDIPVFMDVQNDFNIENGGRYYLSGVTIYHGDANSGHYFIYEQLPSGKWIKISDNWVSGELDYSKIKKDIEKNSSLLVYSVARD